MVYGSSAFAEHSGIRGGAQRTELPIVFRGQKMDRGGQRRAVSGRGV